MWRSEKTHSRKEGFAHVEDWVVHLVTLAVKSERDAPVVFVRVDRNFCVGSFGGLAQENRDRLRQENATHRERLKTQAL